MNLKVLSLSLLGTSSLGGLVVGSYYFIKPTNIKELLIQENLTLLDINGDKNNKEWTKLISKHTKDKELELKDKTKIALIKDLSFESLTKEEDKIAKIKGKCKDLLEKSISKNSTFDIDKEGAKNWCTLESKVLEIP